MINQEIPLKSVSLLRKGRLVMYGLSVDTDIMVQFAGHLYHTYLCLFPSFFRSSISSMLDFGLSGLRKSIRSFFSTKEHESIIVRTSNVLKLMIKNTMNLLI